MFSIKKFFVKLFTPSEKTLIENEICSLIDDVLELEECMRATPEQEAKDTIQKEINDLNSKINELRAKIYNLNKTAVVCIKNLYKSTYKDNAFSKGETYYISKEDDFLWIIDNNKREFSFSKTQEEPYYYFNKYFKKKS